MHMRYGPEKEPTGWVPLRYEVMSIFGETRSTALSPEFFLNTGSRMDKNETATDN